MARGFGATLGVGTTDVIDSVYASAPADWSAHIMSNRNGDGGNGLGRLFDMKSGSQVTWGTGVSQASGGVNYQSILNANPIFAWTRPAASTWIGIGLSWLDAGNIFTAYQGGSQVGQATGTAETPNAGVWRIGNRADGLRNWDGLLAEFGIWSVVLDAAEWAALAKGCSPLLIRPTALVEYIPVMSSNVSYKLAAPTITGTAIQPHPRIIMPRSRQARRMTTQQQNFEQFKVLGLASSEY